ncbi:hypothetical protein [Wolinella succinogenes]|uniref:hypothetical protein n=1 Tax=Wolinella succinogenes TaxID=844 RepID=UPI002FC6BC28
MGLARTFITIYFLIIGVAGILAPVLTAGIKEIIIEEKRTIAKIEMNIEEELKKAKIENLEQIIKNVITPLDEEKRGREKDLKKIEKITKIEGIEWVWAIYGIVMLGGMYRNYKRINSNKEIVGLLIAGLTISLMQWIGRGIEREEIIFGLLDIGLIILFLRAESEQ